MLKSAQMKTMMQMESVSKMIFLERFLLRNIKMFYSVDH